MQASRRLSLWYSVQIAGILGRPNFTSDDETRPGPRAWRGTERTRGDEAADTDQPNSTQMVGLSHVLVATKAVPAAFTLAPG